MPGLARSGSGASSWRRLGLEEGCRLVAEAGLRVSSLCRGGFFTTADPAEARAAQANNRQALEEAAALGAPTLVLVPGGLPPGDRDLGAARDRAAGRSRGSCRTRNEVGVTLGIEPMNPIYAADRGVIPRSRRRWTSRSASIRRRSGSSSTPSMSGGNPGWPTQVQRAGERIRSYQVCDWITPLPADTLLARGMMGDGHVDFAALPGRGTGRLRGDVEVEIFNADLWANRRPRSSDDGERYLELVEPYLGSARA